MHPASHGHIELLEAFERKESEWHRTHVFEGGKKKMHAKKVLCNCEQVIYPLFNPVFFLKNRDNCTAKTAHCQDKDHRL